jgi:hypothetical protein
MAGLVKRLFNVQRQARASDQILWTRAIRPASVLGLLSPICPLFLTAGHCCRTPLATDPRRITLDNTLDHLLTRARLPRFPPFSFPWFDRTHRNCLIARILRRVRVCRNHKVSTLHSSRNNGATGEI